MARLWARLDGHPRLVVAGFGALLAILSARFFFTRTLRKVGGLQIQLGTDGRYYWALMASMYLDGDFDLDNQYGRPEIGNPFKYEKTKTGKYANPFTVGPAIMWGPLFLLSHGMARLVGIQGASGGATWLHQAVTLYGSLLYVFLALLLAYGAARRRQGAGIAFGAAVAAYLCGPLMQYSLYQPYYAHACSAFAVTALLVVWERGRGSRTLRGWLLLGALVGLAALVRGQNLVFALPVLAEGLWLIVRTARRDGLVPALRVALWPLAGAGLALLVFLPQLLAWHSIYGSWLTVPQGPGFMHWGESMWPETLFSSRNGLFPYAPVWALGLLGLVLVTRRDPGLGAALWVTLMATAYVNGCIDDWWAGGSFGGRRYDGLLLHVTLGLAALTRPVVDAFVRWPKRAAFVVLGSVLAVFVTCNQQMMQDYRTGELHPAAAKNMPRYYGDLFARSWIFSLGNPLSAPGAWWFAWDTGAKAAQYDETVGDIILTDYREAYKPFTEVRKFTIRFNAPHPERFVVRGFGPLRKDPDGQYRPVLGGSAGRVVVVTNYSGPVHLHLVGKSAAAKTVRLRWNDRQVAETTVLPGQPFVVDAELTADDVRRKWNLLDIEHPGVADGAEAASYLELLIEGR